MANSIQSLEAFVFLPVEIQEYIFDFLDETSLTKTALSNKQIGSIAQEILQKRRGEYIKAYIACFGELTEEEKSDSKIHWGKRKIQDLAKQEFFKKPERSDNDLKIYYPDVKDISLSLSQKMSFIQSLLQRPFYTLLQPFQRKKRYDFLQKDYISLAKFDLKDAATHIEKLINASFLEKYLLSTSIGFELVQSLFAKVEEDKKCSFNLVKQKKEYVHPDDEYPQICYSIQASCKIWKTSAKNWSGNQKPSSENLLEFQIVESTNDLQSKKMLQIAMEVLVRGDESSLFIHGNASQVLLFQNSGFEPFSACQFMIHKDPRKSKKNGTQFYQIVRGDIKPIVVRDGINSESNWEAVLKNPILKGQDPVLPD
ncbi:MAG: hypothetical protein JSR58_04165 [Verrucomicrobia bacterium]|nr:hypothetical protein [Verrucomicrobiota bacterium]